MLEAIDGIMSRINEIQDRLRQFCSAGQAPGGGERDFASMLGRGADGVDAIIRDKSARFGLDDKLVRSVVRVESNFDPRAVSPKGAAGLMQLMPKTAAELGVDDVFDPGENVEAGTQYLKQMMDRYGNNLELALAAYNAGPAAVDKSGKVPDYKETQSYVKKVLDLYGGTKEE